MTGDRQPVTGTRHQLPLDRLSARDFERLCLWLVEREGWERAEHLGAAGSEQGRDIVAWRDGERWAFQCKRVASFYPADAERELNKIIGLPEKDRPVAVMFLVTSDISATTRTQAREQCAEAGLSCDFWAGTELDQKVKRHPDILTEFFDLSGPTVIQFFRQHTRIRYAAFTALVALAAIVVLWTDLGGVRQGLYERGWWPGAFPPAREGEILIVIARFYLAQGVTDAEIHREIRDAIMSEAETLGFSSLRVGVEPTRLSPDDRDRAIRLGRRYRAAAVIWGADTDVRVTVNYLNLMHPDLEAGDLVISETERSRQGLVPGAFVTFATHDLPAQIKFLALFAVGQSYVLDKEYEEAITAIEAALDSVDPDTGSLQGLPEAYFRLGWIYQTLDEDVQAIASYDQAIQIDPHYAAAYYNRGIVHYARDEFDQAGADYDRTIDLNPDFANGYLNRGIVRLIQGDTAGAIADFDRAIVLDPEYARAYYNRALARQVHNDIEGAIADYERASELASDPAEAYNGLCWVYCLEQQPELALSYCEQAVALDAHPLYIDTRGIAHALGGDYTGALADFRISIEWLEQQPQSRWARRLERRKAWVAALEGGTNPFTAELLEDLRDDLW